MKTYLITFVLFFLYNTNCAQDKNVVFSKDVPVTWFGLDFTAVHLIGDREHLATDSIVRKHLTAWNNILITESKKFNIADAIGREKVNYKLDITNERNTTLKASELYTAKVDQRTYLRPANIQEIIDSYDFKGLKGLGLMFNIETFNKIHQEASLFVTFIDLDAHTVIFTERMTSSPSGFGMRNYWANAVYKVMKDMKKKDFATWRKKYFRR